MAAKLSDPQPLLVQLREATRELHASLDSSVGGDIARSRESYARFLAASRVAVRAVERGIEARLGPDFAASREALLDADLSALGVAPDAVSLEELPIRDEAAAFGAAYVIEGSALGGLVLADRVRSALGPDAPTAYLSHRGPGSGTGSRWKWFQAQLAAFSARSDAAAHARAAATARAAFDLYARAFASLS